MSIHALIVPSFTQMLQSLSALLDKASAQAEAEGADPAALMAARLAPDMYPLSAQVRFVCIQATEAVARLTGETAGEPLPATETIEAGKALIADTVALLASVDAAAVDAAADKPIELSLPNGMTFDLKGDEYVRDWVLPQFYFHMVTAYALLRHGGVPIGKADYVWHMFAYIRQPKPDA